MQQQQYKIYGHIEDVCLLGHGSIGRGVLPLLKRHFTFDNLTIVDPHPVHEPETSNNIKFLKLGLTKENYRKQMDNIFAQAKKTKFCINLTVDVSSIELMIYCQERGILYIDTANYPWGGDMSQQFQCWQICNYAFRKQLKEEMDKYQYKTTAICSCGANPGMVSWLVKKALINLAKDTGYPLEKQPTTQPQWALLMKNLGVKGIHIAERDTQRTNEFRPSKHFWNTWSIDGYIAEGSFCVAELSWGTHQKKLQANSFFNPYKPVDTNVVYFNQPGMTVTVKSWCPTLGPQLGYLITHYETFSISEFFTIKEGDKIVYRPTCHYAYHPAPDAMASTIEMMGSGLIPDKKDWKVLQEEIVTGMDELGVLLYGHSKNAYWYGSQLTIEDTRKRITDQNATALQVTSAVIAGIAWALKNPQSGFVEADQMDYQFCLQIQDYYISPVKGYYTDWTPVKNVKNELTGPADPQDPWQFSNILIHR